MTIEDDARMLRDLVAKADELDTLEDESDFYPDNARKAFREMLDRARPLTDKQRQWVKGIYERVFGVPQYENLISTGRAPRGREVDLLIDKMPKPLKPPSRRQ